MTPPAIGSATRPSIGLVVLLLLFQFTIRAHAITQQPAFIDESYHNQRAVLVWPMVFTFSDNPGRFSQGKVLLYFWLGLFEGDRTTALFVSRIAIALFSLLTGAAIFAIGRELGGYPVGSLALLIYTVAPLAVYHERMALADPFAAAFGALLAWRSLIFARRPRLWEGMILGALLTAATLAKLTMALLPILPLATSMGALWLRGKPLQSWPRRYLPPLIVAAAIVLIAWLPLLIPAYLARDSDRPFVLLNEINIDRPNSATPDQFVYAEAAISAVLDFSGIAFPTAAIIGVIMLFWFARKRADRRMVYNTTFLVIWLAALIILPLALASLITARYFMPIAAPLSLVIAYAITQSWRVAHAQPLIRIFIIGALTLWIVTFAAPFAFTLQTDPAALPLHGINLAEREYGSVFADATTTATKLFIESRDSAAHIYGDWGTCNLLYLATVHTVICLPRTEVAAQFAAMLRADLKPRAIDQR